MKEIEMVRIGNLATELSMTERHVTELCEKFDVPIVKAGRKKIRMVSRELFLKKTEQEADNERN